MNKKLKLALAALLGFSTACSTVKNAPAKGAEEQKQETGSQEVQDSVKVPPRIVVMYGVRPPGQAGPATGVHIPRCEGAVRRTGGAGSRCGETDRGYARHGHEEGRQGS